MGMKGRQGKTIRVAIQKIQHLINRQSGKEYRKYRGGTYQRNNTKKLPRTEGQIEKANRVPNKNYTRMTFKTTKKIERKDSIRITFDLPMTTLQAGRQRSSAFKILSKNCCQSRILYPIKLLIKCTIRIVLGIQGLKIIYPLYILLQEVTRENVPPKQEHEKKEMKAQDPGRRGEGNSQAWRAN